MNLSLSHSFRRVVTLTLTCLVLTNITLANQRMQSVPDFRNEKVERKPPQTITMYDFQYSKTSYHYAAAYETQKTKKKSPRSIVSKTSRSKKSNQETGFPSLALLKNENKEQSSKVKQKKEEANLLKTDDDISFDIATLQKQIEEPSLIAAEPFEKIALHFEDSSESEETEIASRSQTRDDILDKKASIKVDLISLEPDFGQTKKRDKKVMKTEDSLELELTPPQVNEKHLMEEIDFDSVMNVIGKTLMMSAQNFKIYQLRNKIPDFSTMFYHIAGL